jgi:threonylcarbamoyladenosine tRNA methylthiotransferase MtaB
MDICRQNESPAAAIVTFGCRLNQADEALLAGRLAAAGYRLVSARGAAAPDLIVVNTCAVTAAAAQKSRQAARALRRQHPDAMIVAVGCGPQAEPERWADGSVDLAVDNPAKLDLPDRVAKFAGRSGPETPDPASALREPPSGPIFREQAAALFPRRTRASLKIQEGCNGACTYCIVPRARGPERSRDRHEIAAEFARLVAAGHREIVLTGINICAWGQDGQGIADLVETLLATPGEYRIRLGSLEPHPAVDDLIALMAARPGRICRFLHLPLQHGDDAILARMNRPCRTAQFATFARDAAARIPGIHLGTDLIVGFPGESEESFCRCRDFIADLPLANLHRFRFSPRPGTPAASFPDPVPQQIALRRSRELAVTAEILADAFRAAQLGHSLAVLTEKRHGATAVEGWTDSYLRVRIDAPGLPLNALIPVRIVATDGTRLVGIPA